MSISFADLGKPASQNSVEGITNASTPAAARRQLAANNSEFANAVSETNKKQSAYTDAVKKRKKVEKPYLAAKKDYDDANTALATKKRELDALENTLDTQESTLNKQKDEREELQDKYDDLVDDGSDEALAEAAIIKEKIKKKDKAIKKTEDAISETETDISFKEKDIASQEEIVEQAESDLDTKKELYDDAKSDEDDALEDYNDAKETEEEVRNDQEEEYPETFGKMSRAYDNNMNNYVIHMAEKEEAELIAAEANNVASMVSSASNDDRYNDSTKEKLSSAKRVSEVNAILAAAEARIKADEVASLKEQLTKDEDLLESGTLSTSAYNTLKTKIKQEKENLGLFASRSVQLPSNTNTGEAVANNLFNSLFNTMESNTGHFVHFDAPPGGLEANSLAAETITNQIFAGGPKLKHGFKGTFPGNLGGLTWTIKSMDKPKMDIEYVEQLRNNTVRYYPIKYSLGEVAVTLWDDTENASINALKDYFYGKVITHDNVSDGITFLMRDSVVIPAFTIEQYNIVNSPNQLFIFENALVSSIEMDQVDDESDEGLGVLNVTFKYEKYSVIDL